MANKLHTYIDIIVKTAEMINDNHSNSGSISFVYIVMYT